MSERGATRCRRITLTLTTEGVTRRAASTVGVRRFLETLEGAWLCVGRGAGTVGEVAAHAGEATVSAAAWSGDFSRAGKAGAPHATVIMAAAPARTASQPASLRTLARSGDR